MKTIHDSETLQEGQQVITACIFLHHVFDGVEKVFVAKRAATKKFLPNVYELPGGHIDYGEEIPAGLIREIKEEFEVDVRLGDPFYIFTYVNPIKKTQSVEIIYFGTLVSPVDSIVTHPDDHAGYKWIAENELSLVTDANKGVDDVEFRGIKKGFELLNGTKPLIF